MLCAVQSETVGWCVCCVLCRVSELRRFQNARCNDKNYRRFIIVYPNWKRLREGIIVRGCVIIKLLKLDMNGELILTLLRVNLGGGLLCGFLGYIKGRKFLVT